LSCDALSLRHRLGDRAEVLVGVLWQFWPAAQPAEQELEPMTQVRREVDY
jgi:hypothetical protein